MPIANKMTRIRLDVVATVVGCIILLVGCSSVPTASAPSDQRFATTTVTSAPVATPPSTATSTPVETATAVASSTATPTPADPATVTPVATSTVAPAATSVATFTPTSVAATATAAPSKPTTTPSGSIPVAGQPVTLANNGQTISMHVGDSFLLQLGSNLDWTVNVADQTIVSRQVNIMVVRGAQGVYVAHKAGQTTLNAVGDPPCRSAQPPCAAPSQLFRLTIVVH